MRDVNSHKMTSPEHWNLIQSPGNLSKEDRSFEAMVETLLLINRFTILDVSTKSLMDATLVASFQANVSEKRLQGPPKLRR